MWCLKQNGSAQAIKTTESEVGASEELHFCILDTNRRHAMMELNGKQKSTALPLAANSKLAHSYHHDIASIHSVVSMQ